MKRPVCPKCSGTLQREDGRTEQPLIRCMQCGWHIYKAIETKKPKPEMLGSWHAKKGGKAGGNQRVLNSEVIDGAHKVSSGSYTLLGYALIDSYGVLNELRTPKTRWKVYDLDDDYKFIASTPTKSQAILIIKEKHNALSKM